MYDCWQPINTTNSKAHQQLSPSATSASVSVVFELGLDMRKINRHEGAFSDPHVYEDSSDDEPRKEGSLGDPPSLKEAMRRRRLHFSGGQMKRPSTCSSPCMHAESDACANCSGVGKVTRRLFAGPWQSSEAPTEGTAGHIQARTRPVFPSRRQQSQNQQQQQQRQEDLDDAACEATIRRCIYSTARAVRVLCLLSTPLLILFLFLGPSLYNKMPPEARYLSSFAFPALRLWADRPTPTRQHPSPSCSHEENPGFFSSLFFSQTPGVDSQKRVKDESGISLPSVDSLREEFAYYNEGHVDAPPTMLQHTKELRKELLEIADGAYVALGFGLANCVILEGPEGLVVVDTMESTETMGEVWRAWQELQQQKNQNHKQKHVKAIIYTHFHTDHTFGAAAVYEKGVTEVHAFWLTRIEMEKVLTVTAGTTYRRSMRQFGVYIHSNDFINAGIGPRLRYDSDAGIGTVLPTHTMRESRKQVVLAGIELELIHAPGESRDQLVVWLPSQRLLIGADNVYKSLPNIYAIRGTETRNCNDWVASLDLMRSLQPEILVLGHTRPLQGAETIHSTLTAYRDAIQFMHDQTVRLMNKGMTLNDIAQTVHLPKHLAKHPFLQPLYGTVPWAVRAIFTHYMGWFSGSPEELSQLSTFEKAEELQDLAGAFQRLLYKALEALRESRFEWALELATAAHTLRPNNELAKELRVLSLRALASKQTAATGRNWYLTSALEVEGFAHINLSDSQKRQVLHRLSMGQIFALLPVRLDPDAAESLESLILFKFAAPPTENDAQRKKNQAHAIGEEQQCVHFRRGIVYTRKVCERNPDVIVETTAAAWLRILTRETGPVAAAARGDIKVKGSITLLVRSLAAVELDAD